MMALLQDRRALITGSTSGIGRAIALRYAEHGARVVVTGRRVALGHAVVDQIVAAGGRATFFQADLENSNACHSLVNSAVEYLGGLDILVNNAALIPRRADEPSPDGPLHQTEEEYWDRIYRAGLKSVLLVSKLAIPFLLASPHATIIHMSSVLGIHGHGSDVYSAIKGALVGLTRSMAVSYAHQIRVNCICPGIVVVERNQEVWATHPEMVPQARAALLTRVGTADDIAQYAVYLASPAGEIVSGSVFAIDQGMSAKGSPLPRPDPIRADAA